MIFNSARNHPFQFDHTAWKQFLSPITQVKTVWPKSHPISKEDREDFSMMGELENFHHLNWLQVDGVPGSSTPSQNLGIKKENTNVQNWDRALNFETPCWFQLYYREPNPT